MIWQLSLQCREKIRAKMIEKLAPKNREIAFKDNSSIKFTNK